MAKFKIQKSATVNQYADATNVVGGTGGLTSITGTQVQVQGYVTSGIQTNGSILRQKGKNKFLINDSTTIQDEYIATGNAYVITLVSNTNWAYFGGPQNAVAGDIFTATRGDSTVSTGGQVNLLGVCSLVNKPAGSLAQGEMSLNVNTAVITTATITNVSAGSTTYAYVTFLNANVAGPAYPYVGQTLYGTGITGTVTIASINKGATSSNANVSFSSQSVANAAAVTLTAHSYAARLTNKTVTDFAGNKANWTFSAPTATTFQISGA